MVATRAEALPRGSAWVTYSSLVSIFCKTSAAQTGLLPSRQTLIASVIFQDFYNILAAVLRSSPLM